MTLDLSPEVNKDIEIVKEKLLTKYPEIFRLEDDDYMVVKTPFVTNPDSANQDWLNKLGIVFFPTLLYYQDSYIPRGNPEIDPAGSSNYKRKNVIVPWISVRFQLHNPDSDLQRSVCKWFVKFFKDLDLCPFLDEDSTFNHYKKIEKRNGYFEYTLYVNPSYPEGFWENHTL